jgi:hypothetical protein
VRQNRSGGPERVIDLVNARAPDGFDKLHDVATPEELEAVVRGYQKMAGFRQGRGEPLINPLPAAAGSERCALWPD